MSPLCSIARYPIDVPRGTKALNQLIYRSLSCGTRCLREACKGRRSNRSVFLTISCLWEFEDQENHDEHNERDVDPEQTLWSIVSVVVKYSAANGRR